MNARTMIDRITDIIGGTSWISGMIMSLYVQIENITDPIIKVLTVLTLFFGILFAIARWRGKLIENKINKKKLEDLENNENEQS
jgi:membrane protein DedA with SNARE-associated domain